MDIEYLLASPRGRCTSRYIKANFPEEYEKIIKISANTFSEQLYIYIHGVVDHVCPVCGKETSFKDLLSGYSTYCSTKCSYKDPARSDKTKHTNLRKYGVENPSQSQQIKDKRRATMIANHGGFGFASKEISEKSQQTIFERYGVGNISQCDYIQSKRESTMIERYGVRSILEQSENRKKAKDALIRKYGVDSYFKAPGYKDQELRSKMIGLKRKHPMLIGKTTDGLWIMSCPHPGCDKCDEKKYIIPQQTYHDRVRGRCETCTHLLNIGATNQGTTIELFVRNILDRNNIEYEVNVRNVIKPKELDIYIPSEHIAIECNGIFWHSRHDSDYHQNKFELCKEKGIQLLSIWEDWIATKPEIVESLIENKLGICKHSIYARCCVVKEVSSSVCRQFLNQNHIQGECRSTIRYGLYYNNELVSIMCFAKRSKLSGSKQINNDEFELIRFCSKIGSTVVGGASKLLKHFIKEYNPQIITSFSSNDISIGNLYKTLGFDEYGENSCYWYIDPSTKKRYHRTSFTKNAIVKKGWKTAVDKSWTEFEITKEHGLLRIYDSGTTKWIYRR